MEVPSSYPPLVDAVFQSISFFMVLVYPAGLILCRNINNTPFRLPRKYSNDKHRDASNPIVGNSGATPLHFAAANGHHHVVQTLLRNGAYPDRPDKHGVTPEALARQKGWQKCADTLAKWSHEKDKDLREREVLRAPGPVSEFESPSQSQSRLDTIECKVFEKKVRVKRSIDTAFNILRPALPTPPLAGPEPAAGSPADASPSLEFPPRRPSLPHIFDSPPPLPHNLPGSHHRSSGRPSFSCWDPCPWRPQATSAESFRRRHAPEEQMRHIVRWKSNCAAPGTSPV